MNAHPDYELLFYIRSGLRKDANRMLWIGQIGAPEYICGIEEETGRVTIVVENILHMPHNSLPTVEEYLAMKGRGFKFDIAQVHVFPETQH